MAKDKARQSQQRIRSIARQPWILLIVIAVIATSAALFRGRQNISNHVHSDSATNVPHVHIGDNVEAPHLHGMGYSADGERLYIAAHNGLRVFVGNEWLTPDVPAHDYMGYSPTDNGFYSSGHPALRTELANPLGLVRSTDEGRTISTLGFAGESDFHVMATGYRSHTVYLFNTVPTSGIGTGLYSTQNDGEEWEHGRSKGVTGDVIQLAVHPDNPGTVAIATSSGVFLSTNRGHTFTALEVGTPITAVAFTQDGSALHFGTQEIRKYDLTTRQTTLIPSPDLMPQDAISFIAFNPVRSVEMAVATFERNIYVQIGENSSAPWALVMRQGVGSN